MNPNWNSIEKKLSARGYSDAAIARTMPLLREIHRKREEKNAVILAHYYQIAPIQLIADKVGDSYTLAKTAKNLTGTKLVVSATVEFMAEMIKLLSPDKKVVIPGLGASCSIAEGMNPQTIARIREAYPGAAIVGYINALAETMAAFDATCTSSNALEVVSRIEGNPVIMVPDYYLAVNTLSQIPLEKEYLAYKGIEGGEIILHDVHKNRHHKIPLDSSLRPRRDEGTCIVHERFSPADVDHYRSQEGVDLVLGHPEVKPEVAAKADFVGSTGRMIQHVKETDAKKIMVISECDLVSPLMDAYPDRAFVTPCKLCPYMKRNTVENLLAALEHETHEIVVPETVREGARLALDKMFDLVEPATIMGE